MDSGSCFGGNDACMRSHARKDREVGCRRLLSAPSSAAWAATGVQSLRHARIRVSMVIRTIRLVFSQRIKSEERVYIERTGTEGWVWGDIRGDHPCMKEKQHSLCHRSHADILRLQGWSAQYPPVFDHFPDKLKSPRYRIARAGETMSIQASSLRGRSCDTGFLSCKIHRNYLQKNCCGPGECEHVSTISGHHVGSLCRAPKIESRWALVNRTDAVLLD